MRLNHAIYRSSPNPYLALVDPYVVGQMTIVRGPQSVRYDRNERLWVEPFIRYAAKQDRLSNRDIRDPRIDPTRTDGWATLNLRLGWRSNERFFGTFALENITDKTYREHGSGLGAAGINAIVSFQTAFGSSGN